MPMPTNLLERCFVPGHMGLFTYTLKMSVRFISVVIIANDDVCIFEAIGRISSSTLQLCDHLKQMPTAC